MSSKINLSIDVSALAKEKFVTGKNGKPYYSFTIDISDEKNEYDQNVTAYESKTKEEVEAKKSTKYIGNGRVYYTDGKILTSKDCPTREKNQKTNSFVEKAETVDLPF
tara:strand:- start:102 stop:425 length:324 start_codon:yes stop_codon:yes gene_type:complete